jgi:hypothetical protein
MSTPDDSISPNDADATPYWALPAIQCLAAFQFEPAGSLEPMCRKCGASFGHPDKPPRKCEHCKAPIRQKRRSFDGQFVYVNEVDTERLLLEGRAKDTWALISNANAALYDDTASKLEGQLHRWPLHVEVLAHVLTALQRRAWQARNFAYFSGLFAQRGLLRWRAGDTRGALDLALQTCYLVACGPRNSAIDFESGFSPWRRHGRRWRRESLNPLSGETEERFSNWSPFPAGLLSDVDDYRKELDLRDKELEVIAAAAAAAASKYSAGVIATEEFVSELLRELRASRRR